MTIRERTEELEHLTLSPKACFADQSRGRERPQEKCDIRTEFQRDRDKIIHSKSFRRLKHKTQVFIIPEGDHYRTRLTHTLEVSQIARTIGRGLRLNEDLIEAISLGHDLGHTPFGHAGERTLDKICPYGFSHNKHSLRVVEALENGTGLNLTWEVRDGIVNHRTACTPSTLEGTVVKYADKFAYINHDIDDAIRGGILKPEELPRECTEILGDTHGARIDTLVSDIIYHELKPTPAVEQAAKRLREFMFERVYIDSAAKIEEKKAENIIAELYDYYIRHPERLPAGERAFLENESPDRVVCDYIAGMSDSFAVERFCRLFLPNPWKVK